jgi:hypothetical protein
MKMRLSGAVLAAAASFMLCAAPAHADNYPVKDGSGALQTFASKVAGFIHHPLHVMEGLFGGAPTPVNMTNAGALDVTVVGGATGTTTKANAADPTLIEGSGTNQLSTDLAGYLRVLTKQSGVWTVNLGSLNGAATAAKQPSLGTAGAASTDVLTVQGISSMTPLKVDGSAVTQPISGSLTNISGTISLPTGASTSANQATANTSLGTIATNSAAQATAANQTTINTSINSVVGTKAAGTAAGSSELVGCVFNTSAPTLTNGQQVAAQCDAGGNLKTTTSATITPFAPTGNASLAVTTTTARVAFGSADTSAIVSNTGTAVGFFKTGTSAVTAATTDTPILPGQALAISTGGAADIAAITSSGSTSLTITTGTGFPAIGLAVDASKSSAVVGSIASGATASDPPVFAGCRASSTAPTAVSDGQVVAQRCGLKGGGVEHPFTVRELASRSAVLTLTSTTETTLIAAGGSGVSLDMAGIKLCNTSATAVRADVRDATAGTVQDTWYLPAGECEGQSFTTPLKQTTANNNWTLQLSGAVTDVRVVAQFVQQ